MQVTLLVACGNSAEDSGQPLGQLSSAIVRSSADVWHKYVVQVQVDDTMGEVSDLNCSGTVIGTKTVLTETKCVLDSTGTAFTRMKVIVNAAEYFGTPIPKKAVSGTGYDNVALIRLDTSFSSIEIINMRGIGQIAYTGSISESQGIMLAGYGTSDPSDYSFSALSYGCNRISKVNSDNFLFKASTGSSTCAADLGGPAFGGGTTGDYCIVGINHGQMAPSDCTAKGGDIVETRIDTDSVCNWIKATARETIKCECEVPIFSDGFDCP